MFIHLLICVNVVTGYVTKGDNKNLPDEWHPKTGDIVGRVRYDVPGFGNKLAALTRPTNLGGLVAALTVAVMLLPSRERTKPVRQRGRHAFGN